MWWPSFLSVLQDLFNFALGRTSPEGYVASPVQQQSSNHLMHHVSVQQVNAQPQVVCRLEENVRYGKKHETTKTVRDYLMKEVLVEVRSGDLTQTEWVMYRLHKAGKTLPYLALAASVAGRWHELLKGKQGVDIHVAPRTSSLMEWQDGVQGYLMMLETVTPDETVTGTMVGVPLLGTVTSLTYTKEQWRELRPVFITVQ